MNNLCPLCNSIATEHYTHTNDKDFFRCTHCDLIFVSKLSLLDKVEEKKRYDKHRNAVIDAGYKNFLNRVIQPIKERIPKNSTGLDYGSGPFPALVKLLEKTPYNMEYFDPYYHNNPDVFDKQYDFITLTEVAEHFYHPNIEFERIVSMLKPKAYLIIMTHRTDEVADFDKWYYKNDDTHVCFYAASTMKYIATRYGLTLEILSDRVVIFQN